MRKRSFCARVAVSAVAIVTLGGLSGCVTDVEDDEAGDPEITTIPLVKCGGNPVDVYWAITDMTPSTGAAAPDGWNLWTNGTLTFRHDFNSEKRILIRAKGDPAGGVWPRMRVTVGGQQVMVRNVSSGSYKNFTAELPTFSGTKTVSIAFLNDSTVNGDRNLYVRKAEIGCAQADDGGGNEDGGADDGGSAGTGYQAGVLPRADLITEADLRSTYSGWKSKYIVDCGSGRARVENFENGTRTTYSEGQGYGMLIAAYMNDRTLFDRLWAMGKARLNGNGVMGWQFDCNGYISSVGGSTSATDGDLDAIMGLAVAADRWGSSYRTQAVQYITDLKDHNFLKHPGSGTWIQAPGDDDGRRLQYFGNSSYFIPAYYRVFQQLSGDADWGAITSDTYDQLEAAAHGTTGLVGNEVYWDGRNKENQVDYNGARMPWRLALDVLWHNNSRGKALLAKQNAWAVNLGVGNIRDGYNRDGTMTGGWNESPAFMGAWAVGMMARNQASVNTFTEFFVNRATFDQYYATSLRLLYQLTLTGRMWRPGNGVPAGL